MAENAFRVTAARSVDELLDPTDRLELGFETGYLLLELRPGRGPCTRSVVMDALLGDLLLNTADDPDSDV
ncbi:hypothetical protein [Paraburkholderia saeva]|uniref:hypothetical protein n=1 Tax=Paraburkholderia saeva TaxID=2777537 RepID=UPI002B4B9E19|nr:hypothetical protein [Paraburkholderia saeva]